MGGRVASNNNFPIKIPFYLHERMLFIHTTQNAVVSTVRDTRRDTPTFLMW